jgi:hypothetical protein
LLLAMMAAAPLAELAGFGLVGVMWHPSSPFTWNVPALTPRDLVGQAFLSALARGLILGGVGGALLHREWARHKALYPAPEPRPLTATYPHVLAKTRQSVLEEDYPPRVLPVAPMSGRLFCPGADAFFPLPEAEHTRLAPALSRYLFVIVPGQAGPAPWPEEAAPQVGVLARLYDAVQIWPGEDYQMTVRMLVRVRLQGLGVSEDGPQARMELIEEFPSAQPQAQLDRLRYRLNDYIRSTPKLELEWALSLRDPLFLADVIASSLELSLEERRTLLEDLNPDSRIARVCAWLDRALLEPPRPPEGIQARVTKIFFRYTWDE